MYGASMILTVVSRWLNLDIIADSCCVVVVVFIGRPARLRPTLVANIIGN